MKTHAGGEPLVVAAIPAYNEEAAIAEVVRNTRKYVNRIIVCDDGSTDTTGKIAKGLGVIVLSHKKNLGKGAALRTLFVKAKEIGADILVTLDADGQHDPREIPRLIEAMLINDADVAIGSRFTKTGNNNTNIPTYRVFGNKILNTLVERRLTDTQSGLRVYDKVAIASLTPTDSGMGADSEILIKAKKVGLKIIEIPVNVRYNVPNPSKHNSFYQAAQISLSAFKHRQLSEPRFFISIGAGAALIVALGFYTDIFQTFLITGEIVGNLMLIAMGATIVGAFLLVVGRMIRPASVRMEDAAGGE